jgi:hypothetical protein
VASDLPSTEANDASITIIGFAKISQARRKRGKQKVASMEADSD